MLRKFRIKMNDKEYMVEMEELGAAFVQNVNIVTTPIARTVTPVAPAAPVSANGVTMEAPMPGKVLKVLVKAGEQVKENDPVIILEAMKMENEIVAPKDGTVSAVHAEEGSSIDAGQPIVTIV